MSEEYLREMSPDQPDPTSPAADADAAELEGGRNNMKIIICAGRLIIVAAKKKLACSKNNKDDLK